MLLVDLHQAAAHLFVSRTYTSYTHSGTDTEAIGQPDDIWAHEGSVQRAD
jgi:hypothetical protein